jgi:homoserine O-acetyltransferase
VPKGIVAFGKAYSAWLTSAEWFDQQAYRDLGYDTLSAWDADNCAKGYAGWDPDDLLAKLHMWQAGDVGILTDGGKAGDDESLKRALGQIKARVLLMPCETDQYFRPDANEREALMIPDATLKVIPSIWGHIAGGGANKVDTEFMDREIAAFLKG